VTDSSDQATRDATATLMTNYQTLIRQQRFDDWIALWDDDGVCEFPFALPGRPRLLRGKKAIYDYMIETPNRVTVLGIEEMTIHQGHDPHVLIVELSITGTATETGKPYNQQFVIVAQSKNGKLAHYREYWNPLVSMEAFS
jgi:uncharacterized protein